MVSRGRVDLAAGEVWGAREWCERALKVAITSRDRPVMARTVELRAELALAGGNAERAAELLGTAEALRGMLDEADVDLVRVREAARAALGEAGFALAYQRGTARPCDELITT